MFILCQGKIAKKPYEIPYTSKKVYSIEELCYYIYNNIYTINEDFFQESLVKWLRDETENVTLAKKLKSMFMMGTNLKDLVVTLLCGCDYYKEEEIRHIVDVIDETESLPLYKKKKIKADNFLRSGRYGKSLAEYRKLLNSTYAENFSTEEYGDILHNQGIALFYTSSFGEAASSFIEAYIRNGRKDSLEHYLFVLLMEGKNKEFEDKAISYGFNKQSIEATRAKYNHSLSTFVLSENTDDRIDLYKEQLKVAFSS